MPGQAKHSLLASSPEIRIYRARQGKTRLIDAIEFLYKLQRDLGDDWTGEIRTQSLPLNGDLNTCLVLVVGPEQSDGTRSAIAMPSAAQFSASSTRGELQYCVVSQLDRAVFDRWGNTTLRDERQLHQIDLQPAKLAFQLSSRHN